MVGTGNFAFGQVSEAEFPPRKVWEKIPASPFTYSCCEDSVG